jgi:hypothetical protein
LAVKWKRSAIWYFVSAFALFCAFAFALYCIGDFFPSRC